MDFDNKVWYTIFDNMFNCDDYLYHYTDIDKALQIIDGDSLKFSKISRTNDTLESKLKISIEPIQPTLHKKVIKTVQLLNQNYLKNVQLLCFSRDNNVFDRNINGSQLYTDYSGRGFALPRMWAQYANNNSGICLIFNKEKLSRIIRKQLGAMLIDCRNVKYQSQFEAYSFNKDTAEELANLDATQPSDSGFIVQCYNFLKKNTQFTEYNYFCKLTDWSGEIEYRYIAYNEHDIFVKEINSALVGIVLGERTSTTNEHIIKMLCDDLCEIKKITFTFGGCQLINMY